MDLTTLLQQRTSLVIFMTLFFIVGLYLLYQGLHYHKLRRVVEDIPTSKVRSIAIGLVEVFGKVKPAQQVLQAPLSGAKCVFYGYKIELYYGRKNYEWRVVDHIVKTTPFYLEDNTGKVLVDPTDANIEVTFEQQIDTKEDKMPAAIKSFLAANKPDILREIETKKERYRFTEQLIPIDTQLYVLGSANTNPEAKQSTVGVERLKISKGKDEKLFYLSSLHQDNLQSVFTFKGIACLVVGILMCVGSFGIIFIHLTIL